MIVLGWTDSFLKKKKNVRWSVRTFLLLSRAVYVDADVLLLDDPLGAVDTAVGRLLFTHCIKTHLKDKACILVTHQLQYLKEADSILVLNGVMISLNEF